MNSSCKKYYKELRTLLPTSGKYEKMFLKNIYENLDDFSRENPTADYSAVSAYFGAPQDMIITYFENIDTPYLIRRIRLTSVMRKFISILALIIICIFIFRAVFSSMIFTNALQSGDNAYRMDKGFVIENIHD